MVAYGGKCYKEFKPTKMTKIERFRLFFKKTKSKSENIIKTETTETNCVLYYKTLGEKVFLLDEVFYTNIKLPDISFVLNSHAKKENK